MEETLRYDLARARRDREAAASHLREAREIFMRLGAPRRVAEAKARAAEPALVLGD